MMRASRGRLLGLAAIVLATLLAGEVAWWQILVIVLVFALALILPGPKSDTPHEMARADPAPVTPELPLGLGQTLLRNLPAPLFVIGDDRRLEYANPAAARMVPQARTGMYFSAVIRAPVFLAAVDTVLRDKEDMTFNFTLLQGRERYFEARASYVPNTATGSGGQVVVLFEDRTQDKALLQTRADFVANASHELRTPLASILGYIETLQGHAKDDPEAQELFLGIMMQQARRMQRLVDDLMSLNRIEMNAHIRPEARMDLYETVAEAGEALIPVASQADVMLSIELPPAGDGPVVIGDRDQIAQVTVNLLDNAIKYGGRGGRVTVTPALSDPRYPGQTGVSVSDSGPGIARENIPRITERFFRASDTTNKDVGGTGLGLAISKHILTRHGGALDIKSKLGEGSTFTFWLPKADSQGA